MAVVKKRNESTETRLLLESNEAVELPPAEVDEKNVIAQFEAFKAFIPELLDALREGTVAETVPVMMDGSTFVVHGATRSFWVKLWHSSAEMTRIERVHVLGCLPSTRGVQVMLADEDFDDEEDGFDDDEDFLEEENENSARRE